MRISITDSPSGPITLVTDPDGSPVDTHQASELVRPIERSLAPVAQAGSEGALRAPLRPQKIVAIGLNYMDHVREAGGEPPKKPLVFAKFPSSIVGPEADIVIDPQVAQRVDWEVELGVVIGRRMRAVRPEHALEFVFGYTVANDISARDVQFADGQWVRGKSMDTFCPLGPIIVTADEIPDPQSLKLGTTVNGETVQDSSTSEMIFGVKELLAFCSQSFVLEPGDLVLTGTPWGCGEFMTPRRSLHNGDVVESWVEGIGTLRNSVSESGEVGLLGRSHPG
jgi:2-keto-4-pentenoate hydratase/2-oxohepta-3-ene-1,7-dioic acid hydratase in catechol pathway